MFEARDPSPRVYALHPAGVVNLRAKGVGHCRVGPAARAQEATSTGAVSRACGSLWCGCCVGRGDSGGGQVTREDDVVVNCEMTVFRGHTEFRHFRS